MKFSFSDFYLSNDNINIINEWIESFQTNNINYPLIIYGSSGIGKISLAKTILKDYTIIEYNYNIDIDDCLLTLDISSMFTNKINKSVIFYGQTYYLHMTHAVSATLLRSTPISFLNYFTLHRGT